MNTLLPGLLECGALLAIGHQLRQSGMLRPSDAQTAIKLGTCLTLPSVIIRSLCTQGPIPVEAWLGAGVALAIFASQAAAGWVVSLGKQKRQWAVMMGSTVGLSLPLVGLPVGEALLGLKGLQPLVLITILNSIAVRGASYMLFGSAGPAFPESYKHEDGATYRGQWRGMRKEGLGVYRYGSGARYEGEWRDNDKDGRGVYYFPKGGTYEGEWAGGQMNGVGIRTFSTGEVKAGRWEAGKLVTPLELWQCVYAAEGAAEAAIAAQSVQVGGGRFQDAVASLLQDVGLWAGVAALALVALQQPLPGALDAITSVLAPANKPLMLMAAGMTLKIELPQHNMVPDVVKLLEVRLLVPLILCAALICFTPHTTAHVYAMVWTCLLVAFMSPVPPEVLQYARAFRLNEGLAAGVVGTSNLVAAPFLLAACLAASLTGLPAALQPTTPSLVAPITGAAVETAVSLQPLLVLCVLGVAAVGAGVAASTAKFGDGTEASRVLMVYAGNAGATDAAVLASPAAPKVEKTYTGGAGREGRSPSAAPTRPAASSGGGGLGSGGLSGLGNVSKARGSGKKYTGSGFLGAGNAGGAGQTDGTQTGPAPDSTGGDEGGPGGAAGGSQSPPPPGKPSPPSALPSSHVHHHRHHAHQHHWLGAGQLNRVHHVRLAQSRVLFSLVRRAPAVGHAVCGQTRGGAVTASQNGLRL